MTDRLPSLSPVTLTRRRRYALAVLPLLLTQPLPGFAQDPPGKPVENADPTPGGAPRGIRVPSASDAPGDSTGSMVPPSLPMPPPSAAPAGTPPMLPPLQQAQPVLPMQPAQAPPMQLDPNAVQADPAQATSDQDPPARVGRVARIVGQVSYRAPGQEEWTPARMNFSVTGGTAIFTQPNARAAIEVNGSRFAFDPNTDFQIAQLTEQGMLATLPQGTAFFRMRGMLQGEKVEVVTPRGTFTIEGDGRYMVEAGDDQRPTRFTAFDGNAAARGDGYETPVPAGQTLVLVGAGAPQGSWQRAQPNALVAWAVTLEGKGQMPASVQQMTGAESLMQYGNWTRNQQYGDVWYPRVEPGWAPYRNGQWVWRDPWGWTWVDDQPWGYAPSHYGRWVQDGGRWGWIPQVVQTYDPGYYAPPRPYWAPALVSFLPGIVLAGLAAPVSWVPLAPYEPFLPWWRASPRYVGYVNSPYVRNVTVINNYWVTNVWRGPGPAFGQPRPPLPGFGPFANLRGATVVPGSVLTGGQRVFPVGRPLPAGFNPAGGAFAPHVGGLPVRPIAQTPGLTPIGANRLGLPVVPPAVRMPGPPPLQHQALLGGRPVQGPGVPGGFTPPPGAGGPPPGAGGPPGLPGGPGGPGGRTGPGVGAAIGAGVAAGAAAGFIGSRMGGNVPPPPGGAGAPPSPGGAMQPGFRPPGPGGGVPPPPGAGIRQPGFVPPTGGVQPPGGGVPPSPGAGIRQPGFVPPAGGVQPPGGGVPPPPGAGIRQPGFIPPTGGVQPPGGGVPPVSQGGRQPGFNPPPGGFQPPPQGGHQPGVNPPAGGFQPPPQGGRQPAFNPPPGGFQPPPQGGRQPAFNPPPGGFQPPPQGGRQPAFNPPPGGSQPPPQQRFNPPPQGGGFQPPPQQRFNPPPQAAPPPPPRPAPPPPPPPPPPRPAAPPPPPPPPRPAPPPPPAQRNPNQNVR